MPLDAFRIFKSSGDKQKEDSIQRRRAQVRKAQRTYQERKNAYAKSLEDALSRSKAREANLTLDNERLRSILDSVADKIPTHIYQQISIPPFGIAGSSLPSLSPMASEGVMFSSSSPSHASSVASYNTSKPLPPPMHGEVPVFTLQGSMSSGLGAIPLGGFDETTIGMEFVLFLERPCLDHIHGDDETPHVANGHTLTVSSQILNVSNNSAVRPPPDPLAISQSLSKAILMNLLELAPQVNGYSAEDLEDREVTPVQAWDWIRRQDHFKQIQVHRLKNLLDEMSRLAKCYGFGSTVPAREFERIVQACIGPI